MKYKRLIDRSKELNSLYIKTKDIEYAMEDDCIMHLFGCGGIETYETICNFVKENKFKKVYDIGCAYGHQSEIFLEKNVDYVGIEVSPIKNFWNADKFKYINRKYPFEINANENDVAVSVLCLTWNCYLFEGIKTLKEQCEALKRDFKHCILYMQNDRIEFVGEYFKNCKHIKDNIYYFYS